MGWASLGMSRALALGALSSALSFWREVETYQVDAKQELDEHSFPMPHP